MSTYVLLDAGPLGLASNPRGTPEALRCNQWLRNMLANGVRVVVPEISDYEVRRELIRRDAQNALKRLDGLKGMGYQPITTESMLLAARLWAECRNAGMPTADDSSLDADVILAAQAKVIENQGNEAVVATTNVGHLSRFISAKNWQDIS